MDLVRTPTSAPEHVVHHTDKQAAVDSTKDRFAQKWGGSTRGNEDRWGGVSRERLIPIEPVTSVPSGPGSASKRGSRRPLTTPESRP